MKQFACFKCGMLGKGEYCEHLCDGVTVVSFSSQTRKERFLDWFFSTDIMFYLALLSGCIINGIFLSHCNWSDGEMLTEAICMGVILGRVLRNERR